jgi:hypothetical protein
MRAIFFNEPVDMMAGCSLLIKFLNYGEMPDEEEPNRRQKRCSALSRTRRRSTRVFCKSTVST